MVAKGKSFPFIRCDFDEKYGAGAKDKASGSRNKKLFGEEWGEVHDGLMGWEIRGMR